MPRLVKVDNDIRCQGRLLAEDQFHIAQTIHTKHETIVGLVLDENIEQNWVGVFPSVDCRVNFRAEVKLEEAEYKTLTDRDQELERQFGEYLRTFRKLV